MYNETQTENIQYCTSCGAANKKSAVCCEACGKKIHMKHRPFFDFLKKHIKDELKGKVTDSIYSAIKNFLLSHVYGVAVSILVVSAGVVTVQGVSPHIETVSEALVVNTLNTPAPPEVEETRQEVEVNQDLIEWAQYLMSDYDGFADRQRTSEPYWEEGSYHGSASEMYADNIAGYNYPSVHEMIQNPISVGNLAEQSDDPNVFYNRYVDEGSFATGAALSTSLGKQLYEDGYKVTEFNYVLTAGAGEVDSAPLEKLVYRVVLVEDDGTWYIAEDRLIERKGA